MLVLECCRIILHNNLLRQFVIWNEHPYCKKPVPGDVKPLIIGNPGSLQDAVDIAKLDYVEAVLARRCQVQRRLQQLCGRCEEGNRNHHCVTLNPSRVVQEIIPFLPMCWERCNVR